MRSRLLAALITLFAAPVLGKPPADAEAAYQAARTGYYALKGDQARRKLRHHWLNVVVRFEAVAAKYPRSDRAPDALFTAGQTLEELSRISRVEEDLSAAIADYERLLQSHPRHRLADDAAYQLARIQLDRLGHPAEARRTAAHALSQLPRGDRAKELKALLASVPEEKPATHARLEPAAPEKARAPGKGSVVEQLPAAVSAKVAELARKPEVSDEAAVTPSGEPSLGSRLALVEAIERLAREERPSPAPELETPPIPQAHEEERPRVAEAPPAEVHPKAQVAVREDPAPAPREEESEGSGPASLEGVDPKLARARLKSAVRNDSEITLAEQLGLKVRRVVIDPGHGGHDTGAIGKTGTREKDVALAISQKVARELRAAGLEVLLTRDKDQFIRLEDRAHFANEERGDLFISIHCNSAHKPKLRGVEVYTLNTSSDRYSIRLAARENASSEKSISDLQFILADLATKANTEESTNLATRVQRSMVSRLSSKYTGVKDLGHKQALFYVLLGAKMPAILVETSFLSNPEEEKRLSSTEYQDQVAAAIAHGVQDFLGHRDRLAKID